LIEQLLLPKPGKVAREILPDPIAGSRRQLLKNLVVDLFISG
jgi:hypothetical protein